jgi:hypothetical protein
MKFTTPRSLGSVPISPAFAGIIVAIATASTRDVLILRNGRTISTAHVMRASQEAYVRLQRFRRETDRAARARWRRQVSEGF